MEIILLCITLFCFLYNTIPEDGYLSIERLHLAHSLEAESSVSCSHFCLGFDEDSLGYNTCQRMGREQQYVEECECTGWPCLLS